MQIIIPAVCLALAQQATAEPKAQTPPKTAIYDEKADARSQIRAATAEAKRENRRVLLQWGANWCPWCARLHQTLQKDADLRKILLYEYDLVRVDVGRKDKNLDLAAHYGADVKKYGIPFLTVLDGDGKVLANQATDLFESKAEGKKEYENKKLVEFLKRHQARPRDAEAALTAALAEASPSGRKVFLHFGAPWCGWCRRLDSWLARPDVAGLLTKDFVELKIDLDRMTGAQEIFKRYNAKAAGGIPWFVFLDAKGEALIDSNGPKGNIGFPAEPDEIVHFMKMLETARRHLSNADLAQLRKSLDPASRPVR
jgi:thioredoxin-related protein